MHQRPRLGLSCNLVELFTPLFTPARFFAPNGTRNFQQVTAPQAQTQFAAECCPLYPPKADIRRTDSAKTQIG